MKKIAFDIMGNDKGILPAIQASVQFVEQNPTFEIILVGNEDEINKHYKKKLNNIKIKDSKITLKFTQQFRSVLNQSSSMIDAIKMVKNDEADAVLSCGDSGMYLASSTFLIGRMPNISRPAFMPFIPTIKKDKQFLLLDVGANRENTAQQLLEWAKLSSSFYKHMFNKENPIVKLINIGEEEYKGTTLVRETASLLQQEFTINYQGFIEPRILLNNETDIAIIDGFSGNLILKSMEGAILVFKSLLKESILKTGWRKFLALLLKPAFKEVGEKFDYRNVGAAWVIGLNKIVIKTHGSSDKKSFLGALNQVKIALEKNILEEVKRELE
ncbi:phosphate acyltransferase PlsX [Mycoplasma sp. M5725]|uniref:Phosphate acyltransferase n=1 Tax=Mycoplasma phocimorsus TaxID=3045839 RepID=A0AAJ1PSK5_9MOLU|nr:phosphate acyltransferase PlsX [Mycoplasma phocimorsus]MDJ1645776.1 phosphate acyltransferase PlsX [Mycoplasma phocimorsus]